MKLGKEDQPEEIDSPVAVAHHQTDLGAATDNRDIAAEYFFTLTKGTGIAALLEGLDNDLCQSPYWGYVVSGTLTVSNTDGSEGIHESGDMFNWSPGYLLRADEDTDFVLFSPEYEHQEVIDHIRNKMEKGA